MKIISNLLFLALICSSLTGKSQTDGTLAFSIKTISYSAPYSPKHILAIWISDSNGQWVKTLKFRAQNQNYMQYLTNFKNATNSTYNVVDALTGATLQSHTSHSLTWDCTDVNGSLVADGDYTVYVEFTSANTTGKLYSISFTKGPTAQQLTPSDQTYFSNISLTWTPDATNTTENSFSENKVSCYPSPFNESLDISVCIERTENISISIHDINGKAVRNVVNTMLKSGKYTFHWDGKDKSGNDMPAGIYVISVKGDSFSKNNKIIKRP